MLFGARVIPFSRSCTLKEYTLLKRDHSVHLELRVLCKHYGVICKVRFVKSDYRWIAFKLTVFVYFSVKPDRLSSLLHAPPAALDRTFLILLMPYYKDRIFKLVSVL